jgi:putative aldouronate transport system permease protein
MSFLGIAGSVLPVIFAVMLNEIANRPFKRIVQTLVTLPNFISWILVFSVVWAMLSVGDGFVNRLLVSLGVTRSGINFMASQNNVWVTQWLYTVWKTLGWSMIIYLAAISGIDQEMYEAARIDGASRFKIILHITIPALIPTFSVLLLLAIANIINNGMEQYFVFQNPMNRARIEVLDLYVYNQGILNRRIPYSTAVSMLKSVISVVLLFVANRGVKLIRGDGII